MGQHIGRRFRRAPSRGCVHYRAARKFKIGRLAPLRVRRAGHSCVAQLGYDVTPLRLASPPTGAKACGGIVQLLTRAAGLCASLCVRAAGAVCAPVRKMPENAKKRALRERASAAVQCRKSRPVKSPQTPAGAPRGRKKGRASPAATVRAVPAWLAALSPPPAPARAPVFDDSGLPCSCCGFPFGRGGATFAAHGEPPCPWDVCLSCMERMMAVPEHLPGAWPGVRA